MKQQATHPTGRAQDFAVNETFFSTTDARGIITAGNSVFERTSAYPLAELIGQPHNIIRHPDVPRAVFRLLWNEAKAGREFIGYVKNHAKNGNHYWVLAVIVPIQRGFLSVRIKPTSEVLATVESLYRQMVRAEMDVLASQGSSQEASDASTSILAQTLAARGFESYKAFGHHALITEIKRRDNELARQGLDLFPTTMREGSPGHARYAQLRGVYRAACDLFALLDCFGKAAGGFRTHHSAMIAATEEFRLAALNSQIASHGLGNCGTVVGTVAHFLNQYACELGAHVGVLSEGVAEAAAAVSEIASGLSVSRIMLEMFLQFLWESDTTQADDTLRSQTQAMITDLNEAFDRTTAEALAAIAWVRGRVPKLRAANAEVKHDIIRIQVAQISGMTEVARLPDAQDMHTMFTGLRGLIETANGELREFLAVIERLEGLNAQAAVHAQRIEASLDGAGTYPGRPSAPAPSASPRELIAAAGAAA